MSEEIETVTEHWTFGGNRLGKGDKRVHEWITPDGTALWYRPVGSHSVGSVYAIKVSRANGTTTRYGNPAYVGRSEDADLRDELSARHRAAEITLDIKRRENKDKTDDPMEVAIQRLTDLAAKVPPSQRAHFAAYVAYRVGKVW